MGPGAARALGRLTGAERPRRLSVVAAAGHGKTRALRSGLRSVAVTWCAGPDVVDGLVDLGHVAGGREWIVVDDLPELPVDVARRLVRMVVGLPESVSVALVSRWPLAVPVSRWRGQGMVAEVGPADLVVPGDQVVAMLGREHGIRDIAAARRVHVATGGWPALVHLVGEALAGGVAMSDIALPGTTLASYIAAEILMPLPADVSGLVRAVGDLWPVSGALCRALGHQRADAAIDLLTRTGLVQNGRIVPVVAQVARQGHRIVAAPCRDRVAAAWYAGHGPPVAAASAYQRGGDDVACARVLASSGDRMVASGETTAVIDMIRALPAALRDRRLRLLLGDALRTAGETSAALATFADLFDGVGVLDADLAWRVGMVHHQMGAPRTALKIYARAVADGGAPADRVWLLAGTAMAHWLLGAAHEGLACAKTACDAAVDDDRAFAAAHVALALCLGLTGDVPGAGEHFARAGRFAERAGDVVQGVRIDINRSHHLLAEACFADAAHIAGRAVRVAESAGPPGMLAGALCAEGAALVRLCRYDDAVERYDRVISLANSTGSGGKADALAGIGEVHRRLGARQQARGAHEEAVRTARDGGTRQVLVATLVGLARLLVDEDATQASALANEARAAATGSDVVPALLAAGYAAAAAGRADEASTIAGQAVEQARSRGERAWLAEALELWAGTEDGPGRQRAALVEAHGIWRGGAAAYDADRVSVALGRLTDADAADRFQAMTATQRLAAAGVVDSSAGGPRPTRTGQVAIRAFGRFEVVVGGRLVPASAWQSRKARDLLRILVARRGRVVPRSALCELLWPDDDPARTAHRLSVLMSIVRTVSGQEVLIADAACVALDLTRVTVDIEDFLADVAYGFQLHEQGAGRQARALLAGAERRYVGEAFEDDPYADWATPVGEEARGVYLRALRLLADLARAEGNHEQATSYLRRLLSVDPYDESVHQTLVEVLADAGRHGEARRSFARYGAAMAAIGVRPPDQAVLAGRT